jgi:hypothetical protein
MLFAAVTHLVEGLSLKTLVVLKVEKSIISLVRTRIQTIYITGQQLVLFLEKLTRKKNVKISPGIKRFEV